RLSNALKGLGIGQGDSVGLFLPMIPEAVVAFLACAKIGAVVVPIFSGFGAAAVAARLADAGAKALITVDMSLRKGKAIPMVQVAADAAGACPALHHVIVARGRPGVHGGPKARRFLDWDDLLGSESSDCRTEPLDPESRLMIAYTSGTTGRPKGAVHVHG